MSKTGIYKYEDLFQEIPGDEENVVLTLPDDVMASASFKEGDEVDVTIENNCIVIKKHV